MTYSPLKKNESIILLVDDDMDDLYLCSEALNTANPTLKVLTSPNGFEAVKHLHDAYANNALPSLIIMDLYMPKMDGAATIQEIKRHRGLSNIPIIMITESPSDEQHEYFGRFDIKLVKKPVSFEQFLQEIEFAFQVVATKAAQ